jgi:hypothetical protein
VLRFFFLVLRIVVAGFLAARSFFGARFEPVLVIVSAGTGAASETIPLSGFGAASRFVTARWPGRAMGRRVRELPNYGALDT